MTEAGCGRCGAVMVLLRRSRKTEKFECPNCGRIIVLPLEADYCVDCIKRNTTKCPYYHSPYKSNCDSKEVAGDEGIKQLHQEVDS